METLLVLLLILALVLLGYVTLQNVVIRQQQKAVNDFALMLWKAMPSHTQTKPPVQEAKSDDQGFYILLLLAALVLLLWLLPYTY